MLIPHTQDGLLFRDQSSGEEVVFNYRTFCQLIVGCMVRYGGLSTDQALARLMKSTIVTNPPATYADVALLTHEYEYHWAMTLAYGANYWLDNLGVSSALPADYDDWEQDYIASNKLADSSYDYQQ